MWAKVITEQARRVGTGEPSLCNGDAPIYNLLRSFSVPERGTALQRMICTHKGGWEGGRRHDKTHTKFREPRRREGGCAVEAIKETHSNVATTAPFITHRRRREHRDSNVNYSPRHVMGTTLFVVIFGAGQRANRKKVY